MREVLEIGEVFGWVRMFFFCWGFRLGLVFFSCYVVLVFVYF